MRRVGLPSFPVPLALCAATDLNALEQRDPLLLQTAGFAVRKGWGIDNHHDDAGPAKADDDIADHPYG